MGYLDVDQMLTEMTPKQFNEWVAYYEAEPWGEDWRQTAYICTMVGNSMGGKKGGGSFTPSDFLPVVVPETDAEERQQAQDLAAWRAMAAKEKQAKPLRLYDEEPS